MNDFYGQRASTTDSMVYRGHICQYMYIIPGSLFTREQLETVIVSEHPVSEDVQTNLLPRTRAVVTGLQERLNLLLQVTVAPDSSTLSAVHLSCLNLRR